MGDVQVSAKEQMIKLIEKNKVAVTTLVVKNRIVENMVFTIKTKGNNKKHIFKYSIDGGLEHSTLEGAKKYRPKGVAEQAEPSLKEQVSKLISRGIKILEVKKSNELLEAETKAFNSIQAVNVLELLDGKVEDCWLKNEEANYTYVRVDNAYSIELKCNDGDYGKYGLRLFKAENGKQQSLGKGSFTNVVGMRVLIQELLTNHKNAQEQA